MSAISSSTKLVSNFSSKTNKLAVGMRKDIQEIFKETPHNKQVMMYTATLSNDIKDTCRKFMRNPTEVLIENESKLTLHGLK